MKIIVKEGNGENLNIKVPTGLVLNHATAGFVSKICKDKGVDISRKQFLMFLKALRTYKKSHPEWKLLEVEESGGERIEIIL